METTTEAQVPSGGGAFGIDEFCTAHRISRSLLYLLWSKGSGPDWMQIGARRLISFEAAARWRQRCEQAAREADEMAEAGDAAP